MKNLIFLVGFFSMSVAWANGDQPSKSCENYLTEFRLGEGSRMVGPSEWENVLSRFFKVQIPQGTGAVRWERSGEVYWQSRSINSDGLVRVNHSAESRIAKLNIILFSEISVDGEDRAMGVDISTTQAFGRIRINLRSDQADHVFLIETPLSLRFVVIDPETEKTDFLELIKDPALDDVVLGVGLSRQKDENGTIESDDLTFTNLADSNLPINHM